MKPDAKVLNNVLKRTAKESNLLLAQKPFAHGMYRFSLFIVNYYSRVRNKLKLDYDSFIILQTVVSDALYSTQKKSRSFGELEQDWKKIMEEDDEIANKLFRFSSLTNRGKLTVSSICLITNLPKETVRRKIANLEKKNLLINSKKKKELF